MTNPKKLKPFTSDTIVAPATPPGRGGVAMIRVSGPLVKIISEKLIGKIPTARYATLSVFRDDNQEILDEGLALYFPAPHSFTGEDVLELHGHGGPVVVDNIIKTILQFGARYARPGEFSERAFLNNKIDLTQAEAIADLIDASSVQAARASVRSLQGEFSKKVHHLVEQLIQLRIYIEAALDFAEEEIDFLNDQQLHQQLETLIEELKTLRESAMQGSLLREGITVVIAGQPNVGKSSLLNRLSGKDIAIVTDIPGTTRDVLREQINIDGMPLHFIDTAGLRDSADVVEQEGIRRARDEIARADLIVCLFDAREQNPSTEKLFELSSKVLLVRNKIDLTDEIPHVKEEKNKITIAVSAKKDLGIDLLKQHIKKLVGFQNQSEGIFSARRRHLDALDRVLIFLQNGYQQITHTKAGELLAEDLRLAQQALNEITGEFTSDDLLGKIFASFCIGK